MNEHLTDIVNRLASHITEREGRDRKRNGASHTIGGLKVYLSRLVLQIFINQQAKNRTD